MKRLLCLGTLLCLMIGITACTISKRATEDDIVFYYCRQDLTFHESNSVIAQETRSKEHIGDDLGAVIDAYLLGPEDGSLKLLFPSDTELTDVQLTTDTLHITISSDCANLKEIDLIRACACLAKTILPLTEAEIVSISSEDGFAQLDGPIRFSIESILTEDLPLENS